MQSSKLDHQNDRDHVHAHRKKGTPLDMDICRAGLPPPGLCSLRDTGHGSLRLRNVDRLLSSNTPRRLCHSDPEPGMVGSGHLGIGLHSVRVYTFLGLRSFVLLYPKRRNMPIDLGLARGPREDAYCGLGIAPLKSTLAYRSQRLAGLEQVESKFGWPVMAEVRPSPCCRKAATDRRLHGHGKRFLG